MEYTDAMGVIKTPILLSYQNYSVIVLYITT